MAATGTMAGFSEPDDPYAADGEGASSVHRRPRNSLQARESRMPANRMRHRPTTKHPAASDIPGQPHPQPATSRHPADRCSSPEDDGSSDAHVDSPDRAPQLPPLPLSPISPRWASLAANINKTTVDDVSVPQLHHRPHHPTHHNQQHQQQDQHPLQHWHTSRHQNFLHHNLTAASANAAISAAALISPSQAPTRQRSAASSTSPRFPDLASHLPDFEHVLPDRSPDFASEFPLADEHGGVMSSRAVTPGGLSTTTTFAPSSTTSHPPSRTSSRAGPSRPSSRRTGDEQAPMVENFSRPRKASVARPNIAPMLPTAVRPGQYQDESPILNQQLKNWPRARGPSVSSNKSNGTVSIPPRTSNDHLISAYRTPRTVASSGNLSSSGGMISPGLPRPQMAYTRVDGNGPPISSGLPGHPRDTAPWVADQEPRSSYRSQMTASTAPATLFSGTGTQRSSVATKTSSRTSASMHNYGPGLAADDGGMSVEDVMGLYEKGFADSTGAEDNDMDHVYGPHGHSRKTSGATASSRSRSSSATKVDRTHVGNRIREAMSDSLPIPTKPLGVSERDGPITLRDSGAFFRNSGLPTASPDDAGSEPADLSADTAREEAREDVDDSARSKHDSAKLLDSEETMGLRRHNSQRSAGSSAQPAALGPRLSMSSPELARTAADDEPALPISPPTPSQAQQLYSAPTEDDPDLRDRYGFRKHNQYVSREQYDAWDASYTEYLARRKKKWTSYLRDSGLMTENPDRFPAPSAKTKRFIRKGIPPEWRGAAWFYYARGPSILAKHAGVYDDLVARSQRPGECKDVDVEAIERDLHRTFPDNAKFRFSSSEPEGSGDNATAKNGAEEPRIISSLRRVLHAFAIYNPQIGYCQSLNFLAGLLLLFVETEEQAFWLLNVITRVHLPGTHEMSLEGSKVDLGVLMGAVKDSMPGVWTKVGSELDGGDSRPATQGTGAKAKKSRRGKSAARATAPTADRLPPITLCMTAWFMSCFIGTLPIETTLRVWDVFFYEGSRTLFRVALAIFKLGEAEIRAVQDPMEMFGVVQALPRRLLDCNAVMEATFRRRNGFGHLSQETIEERRNERREALKGAEAAAATGGHATDVEAVVEVRRKGTLFGRRNRDRN